MERLLRYRAGANARRQLRAYGFDLGRVRVVTGPASGPKWLVLAGIDRALMAAGLLEPRQGPDRRLLLAGASAGAWRMLAMASADPAGAHAALQEGYIGQVFPGGVSPSEVTAAYRAMLAAVLPPEQTGTLWSHPACDVAVHVVRARGPAASWYRPVQTTALVAAAALNAVSDRSMRLWFEPVLLHSQASSFDGSFFGPVVGLTRENLAAAALATGSVPLYFEPVEDIPGAPAGRYLDGGLCDYHLNTAYTRPGQGLTLLPHFQERIVPNWFDRYLERRRPGPRLTDDLLQIFPSRSFLARLPGGRVPDRNDFHRFVDDPEERIRRWRTVAAESDRLGEQLLDDLEQGRIPDLVEAL